MVDRKVAARLVGILAAVFVSLGVVAPASAAPQGYAPGPACAWQLMSNSTDLNVAFPDANATYWVLPYLLGPGDSISLSGTYPTARYFSLNTYGTDFNTVDTLRDNQIRPASGGNPYATPGAASQLGVGRWSARVVTGAADHSRNEIRGLPAPGKQRIPLGFLIIRVYVPTDPTSVNGGVTLPDVTMHVGGSSIHLPPCAMPFYPSNYHGPIAAALTSVFDQAIGKAAANSFPANSPEATFVNPASTAGLFPNGDNKYIGAALTYRPGRVAVIRGRAPSFPNTRTGASPAQSGVDVRYWSMCQNDKVSPYPVVACKSDFQTRVDGADYYTYVVAAQEDMTSASDPDLTLIRWGSTSVPKKVVFLRHMLPSQAFYPTSVQAEQAAHTDPASSMGAYYPRATYCEVTVLRSRGWQACFG